MDLQNYNKCTCLGLGTYSTVLEYKHKITNKSIALKKFTSECSGISHDMIREISVLKYIDNEFIIPIIDINYTTFKSIILPKYDLTLRSILKEKILTNDDKLSIFMNICQGVYSLHCNGIIHRDLKPNNIMISKTKDGYNTVIIDLGMSKYTEHYNIIKDMSPEVTTLNYRAPEIIVGFKKYDFKIDIWSLGCILIEMFDNVPLFNNIYTETQLYLKQNQLFGSSNIKMYKKFKFETDFVASFKDIYKHLPKKILELSNKMLKLDPNERCSVYTCMNFMKNYIMYQPSYVVRQNYLNTFKFTIKYNKLKISESSTFEMRSLVVNWLIKTVTDLKINDATYFQTIYLLDKYLINVEVQYEELLLVGVTSLWIASKMLELYDISIEDLIIITENSYTVKEMIVMEKKILQELKFDLIVPSPIIYLNIICNIDNLLYVKIMRAMYISTLHETWINVSPKNIVDNSLNFVLNYKLDDYFKMIIESTNLTINDGILYKFDY